MPNLATNIQLIPIRELNPGDIARIRNSVITQVVSLASKELSIKEENLIVRDIEPYTDLGWNFSDASIGAVENWIHNATWATLAYHTITGASTMSDQRFVAIFGIRDNRFNVGATVAEGGVAVGNATVLQGIYKPYLPAVLIKFEVGGAIKAIWDITSMGAYIDNSSAFTFGAIIIPQNVAFNIYYSSKNHHTVGTVAFNIDMYLQLIGVTVEPRGKVVSP